MTSVRKNIPQEIALASNDAMFGMRKHDWNRLKRMIQGIKKPSQFLSKIYSALFGISATSFFNFFTLSQNSSPWVKPFFILLTVATLVLAIAIFIIERISLKNLKSDSLNILEEMSEIEKLY